MSSSRRTSIAMTLGFALFLTAALAQPAAAQIRIHVAAATPSYGESSRLFAIDGTLTAEGRSCQALRDERGRLYTLVGDKFQGLETGDHVSLLVRRVQPRYASLCGQGATVRVGQVQAVWIGTGHGRALYDSRRDGAYTPYVMRDRRATLDRYGRQDRSGRYDRDGRDGRRYGHDDRYDRSQEIGRYRTERDGTYDDDRDGSYDDTRDGSYDNNRNDDNRYDGGRYDDNGADDRNADSYRRVVSVTGRLASDGRCVTVRDSDGRSFALSGDLRRYGMGQTVTIVGVMGDDTGCGPTIDVQNVTRP